MRSCQAKEKTKMQFALVTRRPYCPGGPKKLCFTTLSLIPMVFIARLSVVKQSSFGFPGQYGRRVTRVNTLLCYCYRMVAHWTNGAKLFWRLTPERGVGYRSWMCRHLTSDEKVKILSLRLDRPVSIISSIERSTLFTT